MRVFLAGKVDPRYGAWRNTLLDQVRVRDERSDHGGFRWQPRWVLTREPMSSDDYPVWPQESNEWVLRKHQYVGPFVVQPGEDWETKHTGNFHGNTWTGNHGDMDEADQKQIGEANRRAIRAADLCFCYLNTPDCFGTLVELGYAAAYRVFTYVLVSPDALWEWDDYWYAGQMADSWSMLGQTPLDRDLTAPADALSMGDRPSSPEQEARLVRTAFHHALGEWSTRPARTPTASQEEARRSQPGTARMTEAQKKLTIQLLDSFASIAQWTSDPRVRNEAARMLGVLGAPVPFAPGQRG